MKKHENHVWYGLRGFSRRSWSNPQRCYFEGLRGRLLSASYTPEPGHPGYEPMLKALAALYDRFQENGTVQFDYTTTLYFDRLGSD